MLFNSLAFLIFMPVACAVYWAARGRLRLQNALVLVMSYVFYGWWDWRFLTLIALSSAVDYAVGLGLARHGGRAARRALLGASLTVNLGMLGFFKYFNFFAESFSDVLATVGLYASPVTLQIVLPVGISFYTFQTLSYTVDVYRRQMEPTRDPVAFFAYVAFFPQLVAGPIERASRLLPQFHRERRFDADEATDGMRQILWGLFKKVAVADTCGRVVDDIFLNYPEYSGLTLLLGAFLFAIQIYGDFSGYSDIAVGTGRLLGFRLMRNFAYPYFSRDIAEFWRRWHISLSTWFRDYVYIPLGGSRVGRLFALRNVLIVFLVSGLWHGANWTFVVWGALNAAYFVPVFLLGRNRVNLDVVAEGRRLPTGREAALMATTFALTLVAWVFFRAPTVAFAFDYLQHMVTAPLVDPMRSAKLATLLATGLLSWEWVQRERPHGLEISWVPAPARRLAYLVLITLTVQLSVSPREFIYFQF